MTNVGDLDFETAFDRVFVRGGCLLGFGYSPGIESVGLIYGVKFVLYAEAFARVRSAIESVYGETEAYLRFVEAESDPAPWWRLRLDDLDAYEAIVEGTIEETAVYSTRGRWGVLAHQWGFATVGGTESFIAALGKASFGDLRKHETEWFRDGAPFFDRYAPGLREEVAAAIRHP